MRAPLAFLLGKLNFQKEFQKSKGNPEGADDTRITAEPKSDNLPYSPVEFVVAATAASARSKSPDSISPSSTTRSTRKS